jgi:phage anti-repressor protein
MKIIENELLPIYQNDNHDQLVNARELHEFVGSKQQFTDWIKNRIEKWGFIENIDYTLISQNYETSTGGTVRKEYILTLDTAKELAMVENNDKGRQARKYFIEVEKKYKNNYLNLSPQLQMFKQIFDSVVAQEQKVNKLENKIDVMQSNLLKEHKDDWREYINKVLKAIGWKLCDYKTVRNNSYKELEKRGNCRLETRLNNLMGRALTNGMTATRVNKLNYLDILEDELRLREIYLGIIREYAIKYEIEVKYE